MKCKILLSIGMLVALAIIDVTLVWLGFYDRGVPVDLGEHFLGGVALGIMGAWWLRSFNLSRAPRLLSFFFISVFALLGSFAWELLEYSLFYLTPNFANHFYLYSSTIHDLLSDMLMGLLGGAVVATFYLIKNRQTHENSNLR